MMTKNEEIMYNALLKIQTWFGEFPHTGKYWQNEDGSISDREMSWSVCFGSNGERDYMRKVASEALSSVDLTNSIKE